MSRHPVRLVAALVLLFAGLRWVWNSNEWSGPVIVPLSGSHGVHLNDWLTVLLWAAAFAVACPLQARMIRARTRRALVALQLTARSGRGGSVGEDPVGAFDSAAVPEALLSGVAAPRH